MRRPRTARGRHGGILANKKKAYAPPRMTLIAVCQSGEQFLRATGHSMNGEGWSPNSPAKEKFSAG